MEQTRATPSIYAGLFFTTLSTLMFEILLTRIFSVTMWYHFAFVAVSIALFGMTVGALLVYLLPKVFPEELTSRRLFQATALFGLTMVVACTIQLSIPVDPAWSLEGVTSFTLVYIVTSIPFIFSGVTVCLALTRFPQQVSRLYAVDLVGAALGAAGLTWLLEGIHDGPATVMVVALLAGVGACFFAVAAGRGRDLALAGAAMVVLGGIALSSIVAVQMEEPLLRVRWAKGRSEDQPLWERWNTYSRVIVGGNPDIPVTPLGWAMSPTTPEDLVAYQLVMSLDSAAATVMYEFDGNPDSVAFLRYDVVNNAHFLRSDADVLIIGVGGGPDVLSAISFRQKSVTAIEMNKDVFKALNDEFGDFSGHLDEYPGVTMIHDEARSRLARMDQKFDLLQISLIDTWAATAAGAFALSENGLYTVDAWQIFLDRLEDDGILSVSRWIEPNRPAEIYRLGALAAESLCQRGVENPRDHIMLVRAPATLYSGIQVGTMMISPTPFSEADIARAHEIATHLEFDVVVDPHQTMDPNYDKVIACERQDVDLGVPANLEPPTDDKPFFFQTVNMWDVFGWDAYKDTLTARSVLVLASLSVTVLVLTAVCIVAPILLTTKRSALKGTAPHILYFGAIGLAFIIIEIAQMQRLAIFLGHPTYALSVVLFSLLLFSGIGSMITDRAVRLSESAGLRMWQLWPLAALLLMLIVFGMVTPAIIDQFDASTTPVRIMASVLILAPMGLLMGMPFPFGMKVASLKPEAPTTFFWGVNGATSVCGSVLAVAISISWGISTAFWVGFLCYAVAGGALMLIALRRPSEETAIAAPAEASPAG